MTNKTELKLTKDERQSIVMVKLQESVREEDRKNNEAKQKVEDEFYDKYLREICEQKKQMDKEWDELRDKHDEDIKKLQDKFQAIMRKHKDIKIRGFKISDGYYSNFTKPNFVDTSPESKVFNRFHDDVLYTGLRKTNILSFCLKYRNFEHPRFQKLCRAGLEILSTNILEDEVIVQFMAL